MRHEGGTRAFRALVPAHLELAAHVLNQMYRYGFLERSDRWIIAAAYERTGLRTGRSVVLYADRMGKGRAAGWHLLSTRKGQDFERQFAAQGAELALAYHMIGARLSCAHDGAIAAAQNAPAPLTPRERECLQFAAAGQRVATIAHRLALSESTVGFHLVNARKRLGAHTEGEAVARAVLTGVITI